MKIINKKWTKNIVFTLSYTIIASTPFSTALAQEEHNLFNLNQAPVPQIIKNKEIKKSNTIKVNAKDLALSTSTIKLTLSKELTVLAKKTNAYLTSSGSMVWHGSIVNKGSSHSRSSENTLVLIKTSQGVTATVRYSRQLFKLFPTNSETHLLNEIDESLLPNEHSDARSMKVRLTNQDDQSKLTAQSLDSESIQATTTAVIKVLFAYTPQALSQNPDIEGLIGLAIAETNIGYANSGVNAQIELAYSYLLDYNDSGSHGTDLDRFLATNDGYMDEVHGFRDQYSADVAAIIIGDASACGRAGQIGATDETSFVVIKDSCATGYYSTGHEIGHLMYARHNPEKDDTITPYTFQHGFFYKQDGWRSIMSYDNKNCCTRQNFWSDPTRSFQGITRGSTDTHDNARVLNLEASTIANFRSSTGDQPPTASFSYQVNELTLELTDQSSDAEGPITAYYWDFGDGNNSSLTSPSHTYLAAGNYNVSLTVTDNTGQNNTINQTITVNESIENIPPSAAFIANQNGLTVSFVDQSSDQDGQIASWLWTFGEGNQSTLQNPIHQFSIAGSYEVNLTVTDNEGGNHSISNYITVTTDNVISASDFDSGFTDWINTGNDDWDWTLKSGGTSTKNTGPSSAAGGSGNYVYLETSRRKGAYSSGEFAALEGPIANGHNLKLTFDYHMFGDDIGTLYVDITQDGILTENVWSISGAQQIQQSENFKTATIDLSDFTNNVQVHFRAVAIGGDKGDIALDNILLVEM